MCRDKKLRILSTNLKCVRVAGVKESKHLAFQLLTEKSETKRGSGFQRLREDGKLLAIFEALSHGMVGRLRYYRRWVLGWAESISKLIKPDLFFWKLLG